MKSTKGTTNEIQTPRPLWESIELSTATEFNFQHELVAYFFRGLCDRLSSMGPPKESLATEYFWLPRWWVRVPPLVKIFLHIRAAFEENVSVNLFLKISFGRFFGRNSAETTSPSKWAERILRMETEGKWPWLRARFSRWLVCIASWTRIRPTRLGHNDLCRHRLRF